MCSGEANKGLCRMWCGCGRLKTAKVPCTNPRQGEPNTKALQAEAQSKAN